MTPAMTRFLTAYCGLRDALGRPPALCEVAEALNVRRSSAERTRDRLAIRGHPLTFSRFLTSRRHAGVPLVGRPGDDDAAPARVAGGRV